MTKLVVQTIEQLEKKVASNPDFSPEELATLRRMIKFWHIAEALIKAVKVAAWGAGILTTFLIAYTQVTGL